MVFRNILKNQKPDCSFEYAGLLQNVQLPKLPVPELETTMETYLEFAAVVVSQQALEHSRGLVRGFMEELGPRLQEMLLDRQKEMDNWVSSSCSFGFSRNISKGSSYIYLELLFNNEKCR